jgi:hypothetical protein
MRLASCGQVLVFIVGHVILHFRPSGIGPSNRNCLGSKCATHAESAEALQHETQDHNRTEAGLPESRREPVGANVERSLSTSSEGLGQLWKDSRIYEQY